MAMLVLTAGLILVAAPYLQARTSTSKTILAIFAHPDDDITIGPLLAHYAKQGVRVQLVVVTSGQQGVTPHARIPAGAQLGAVREAESRAACKAYGIDEPILLGEQDGTLRAMKHHDEIVARLAEIVQNVKLSVIITFGPDGVTGHTDHRAVSNMVTEVFQTFSVNHPSGRFPDKLYYVAYPASLLAGNAAASLPDRVATVSDTYVATVVESRDGLAAAARAEECYVKPVHSRSDGRLEPGYGQRPQRQYLPEARPFPARCQDEFREGRFPGPSLKRVECDRRACGATTFLRLRNLFSGVTGGQGSLTLEWPPSGY